MRRTFNEIETTLRKAAIGAGHGEGIAIDIGRAAARLARDGFDGAAAALPALAAAPRMPRPTMAGDRIAFAEARVCSDGPAAIDALLAGLSSEVRLATLDAPLLLVGLAAVAAGEAGASFAIRFDGGASVVAGAARLSFDGQKPEPGEGATMRLAGPAGETDNGHAALGLDVPDEVWRSIEALAARTLVPASTVSRERGAGAGLIDND